MYAGLTPGELRRMPPPAWTDVPLAKLIFFPMNGRNCSQCDAKSLNSLRAWMTAPIPMAPNRNLAPLVPVLPALWISAAARDSGNGRSGSSTITRRSTVTNMIPMTPPTSMIALASR